MSNRRAGQPLSFSAVLEGLKAAGEDTRLRLVAVLAEAELTVSDLTDILGQSQPRISRHLKLLAEAGLVERHREASWVFYRRASEGEGGGIVTQLLDLLDRDDPVLAGDRARLDAVRAARAAAAQSYFAAHARQWDEIRRLHVPEAAVEAAMRQALGGAPIRSLLDLGTGTGRMLELFAGDIERGMGIDLSPDMLGVARNNLEQAGVRNCLLRQSDIYAVPAPRDAFDAVIVHQVLHYLDDGGRALREAARVLRPGGRLLVVDFAPHALEFLREAHAHRHLGFPRETVEGWLADAGLDLVSFRTLTPAGGPGEGLTVSLWLARDPRVLMAGADLVDREIA
ncbi:metalloregulator ArsR/SmtB family transcription factor [Xanthobacter dioxanivorans]|uniref:Metalloregulator ArsR/SmtB family transcription factor n=1 Tax=Xanthobacter dioxanivorans TaxID=2528964 RepID=A0A974PSP6_9HYPH|nr:metalloregulator ArsR/SmtB family transcription factor [Xanthobacter dioxanivorans]QRG08751.1 metalloregulator ArsR/SmtB family transcription factor [Xanthobacter dioxanivorans]